MVKRPEGAGVAQRGAHVGGGIALAQREDLSGVVSAEPRDRLGHRPEELVGLLPHILERLFQLVTIDTPLFPGEGMNTLRVDVEAAATRGQLVAGHAA